MIHEQAIENRGTTSTDQSALADRLHGRLLGPGDQGYEEARVIHNAAYQRSPHTIVQAVDVMDIITTVNFARERGLSLAVRSGGHSMLGYGSSDDMVLDLTRMKQIKYDATRNTVWVQPGATWGEVNDVAQPYGHAVPAGDTASVGVGGLTVGGGVGWLVRKYGLTIDSLLSAEIVTADGRLLTASADTNSDLFWAIRGGGGNFGIVTALEFQAHPVGTIVGGAIFYDATDGKDVLRRYAEYAAAAPDELTTIVFILDAPPLPFIPPDKHGTPVIAIGVCYAGDVESGQRAIEPLRHLAVPVADATGPMPYPAIYGLTQEATVMGHHSEVRSMFMTELDDDALETILKHTLAPSSPFRISQLRVLGGALDRVPHESTAYAHRDKQFMFTIINLWMDPGESDRHRAWTEAFWKDLRPYADGVYVNFLSDEGNERIREAYDPATYARLETLKATYDPTNFFHLNQNIQPRR